VREGYWADLVIFDPEKVIDKSEYKDPHHYPDGIPYVFVNGIAVVSDNRATDAKAGKALRNQFPQPPSESAQ
jgi:N-acyl-D-aspartate/D-glutamate deacylase